MATLLSEAILDGADLRGTDLRGCQGLTAEQLKGAKLDHRTRLPQTLQYLVSAHPHMSCQPAQTCSKNSPLVCTHRLD